MKCLSCNSRGLANPPTRLVLKRLVLQQHKLDLILISESMINFNSFPRRWLSSLQLKLFAMNYRDNLLPNIWCICKVNLETTIISCEDQHATFTLS